MSTLASFSPAAAAKSLQSCPTLRNPMDLSPPGSSVHGILQARVLEWGAIAFSAFSPRWLLILFSPQTSSTSSVPSPSGEQIETLKKTTPTNFHCPIHPPTRTCAHILCLCSGYFVSTVLLPNSLPRISSECVPFSRSVVSDSLRPHGLQHTRLPCPSPPQ